MPKPCSLDLRIRLLDAVIAGASRREAANCFDVSASSAVKWLQRWEETGSIAAKPTGGSISPLEEHADRIQTSSIANSPPAATAPAAWQSSPPCAGPVSTASRRLSKPVKLPRQGIRR